MDLMLAENIRKMRKERALTQEQLAEVLGVTVGAVYKWEAGLSIPDINLIVEMADFFDTSVDSLLGYSMKDNRLGATARRIRNFTDTHDPTGFSETEKALKKFPHSFEIVHECAVFYNTFGMRTGKNDYLDRAIELFSTCVPMLSQNHDPLVDESVLYGELANCYILQGKWQKGIELLKAHNANGNFNPLIGQTLALYGDPDKDAAMYLSYALIGIIGPYVNTIVGMGKVFLDRGEYKEGFAILQTGIDFLEGFRKRTPHYLDRIEAVFLAFQAFFMWKQKQEEEAVALLKKAWKMAESFDKDPDYQTGNLRFVQIDHVVKGQDTLGETAMQSIETSVEKLGDKEFSKLWKSIRQEMEPASESDKDKKTRRKKQVKK